MCVRASRTLLVVLTAGILAAGCGVGSGPQQGAAGSPVAPTLRGSAPSGPVPAGYTPWPEAEHDAGHSAQAAVRGPQTGHLRWKARLGDAVTQGPSIGADGTIYESTDAGILHAINPANGHDEWTFSGGGRIGGDLSTTAAVLPDGTIVWPGPRHLVFGLSARGHREWSVNVGGVPLSPVIAGPTDVYVMTFSGVLTALRVTGTQTVVRWKLKLGRQSYGSPVVRRDGVIETTVDDSLVAVRDHGGTGRQLWRFTVPKSVEVSPAVSATGITVLGTNAGFEYGVSPAGRQLWKHTVGGPSYSSPAVTSGGSVYYGDNSGVLARAVTATGAVIRSFAAQPGNTTSAANIWTAPLVDSAGDVYYGTNGGHIYGYSSRGTRLFAITTGQTVASYPALSARGDLLIGSANGYLYAIGR